MLLVKEPFFQYDFLQDKLHQYTDDILSQQHEPFTIHFFFSQFSLLYKKVIQKYLDITFNEGICQFLKKVLLHKLIMYVAFLLSLSVAFSLQVVCFETKTTREIHSIGG